MCESICGYVSVSAVPMKAKDIKSPDGSQGRAQW